jgi:hypothetical protein
MKFGMDFSLIIAVLVLVQLYILNMKVSDKPKTKSEKPSVEKNEEADNDLYLVVHRSNGDEKVYSKKDVA